MFVDYKNIYDNNFLKFVDKKPINVGNMIFDVGLDINYKYKINIDYRNENKYKVFSTTIYFNKEMSFDLFCALDSKKYFDKLKYLFKQDDDEDDFFITFDTGFCIHKFDLLYEYVQNITLLNDCLYNLLCVYFSHNIWNTKEILRTYHDCQYFFR